MDMVVSSFYSQGIPQYVKFDESYSDSQAVLFPPPPHNLSSLQVSALRAQLMCSTEAASALIPVAVASFALFCTSSSSRWMNLSGRFVEMASGSPTTTRGGLER
jgi:hypothetical protein